MDTNRFARFTQECSGLLSELERVADDDLKERASSARSRLLRERLKILVVGEFSRGKSTFVNALVGRPVLPSKVNPTTATINILRGAEAGVAKVEFNDGTTEEHPLPEQRVNRFLDSIVTVANERAASIRTVTIETPGRLDALKADIVDTPGVNDLDQAREEVTFSYLREADSAVMVLDAQQPLSDSERTFLVDKVMSADVNRIVFVVNKADEILYDGDVADIERVVDYVRGRLRDLVGIADPKVFAVSAKSALRARYKGQDDPFPLPFADFESRLIEDAAAQALANPARLAVHLERLTTLTDAHYDRLQRSLEGAMLDAAQLERKAEEASQRRAQLTSRVEALEDRLHSLQRDMAARISGAATRKVEALSSTLTAELSSATDEDAMEDFRQSLSTHLRALLEGVEEEAARERGRLQQSIRAEFPDLLGSHQGDAAVVLRKRSIEQFRASTPLTSERKEDADASMTVKEMAMGFGLGYVGAALFGPVGIAAGVIGSYFLNKSRQAERAERLAAEERQRMLGALREACVALRTRAQALGQEVAERESSRVAESLRAVVALEQRSLVQTIETARRVAAQGLEERQQLLTDLKRRVASAATLRAETARLHQEYA